MSTKKEISKNEWEDFFTVFTRQHKDWRVSVNQNGDTAIRNQPLAEIKIGQGKVFVGAGDYFLIIDQPQKVSLTTTEQGADESIEISAPTGKILIVIDTPSLPEMVDGIP